MKACIMHVIVSLKRGGAEAVVADIVEQFCKDDRLEQIVVYSYEGPYVQQLQQLGITTYQVKGYFFRYDPLFWWQFYKMVRTIKPKVIVSSLWVTNFASRLLGKLLKIPVICILHLPPDNEGFVRNMLDKYTFNLAQEVIAVSATVEQSFLLKKWTNAKVPVHTIANGINSSAIVQKATSKFIRKTDLGFETDDLIIGTVARLISRKNIAMLVRSFAAVSLNYKKAKLLIIGYGPEENNLRAMIKEFGLQEKVMLFTSGVNALHYYPLFDFFVLPSQAEGLPIALLEAMSFSLPCIVSSDIGSHVVITHEHDGLICLPQEVSLAQAIELLLTDCKLAKQLGSQGLVTLNEKYSQETMVQAYKEICKKYINI